MSPLFYLAAALLFNGCLEQSGGPPEPPMPAETASEAVHGLVSRDEYRDAVERARSCLTDLGFETSPIEELPDGIRLDFGVDPGTQPDEAMWQAWDDCRQRHSYVIEVAYFAQQVRPSAEAPALKAEMVDCLKGANILGVYVHMEDGAIASMIAAQEGGVDAWACRERYLIRIGLARPRPPQPVPSGNLNTP